MINNISLPKSINLSILKKNNKNICLLTNPNGSLKIGIPKDILIYWNKKNKTIFLLNKSVDSLPLVSLISKKITNGIKGLSKGFTIKLKLVGRGFKYAIKKKTFFLNVGFSHVFKTRLVEPLKIFKVGKSEFNLISLSQQQVNQKSFTLQNLKFPDSYKGKGICLVSKTLTLKAGKKKMY